MALMNHKINNYNKFNQTKKITNLFIKNLKNYLSKKPYEFYYERFDPNNLTYEYCSEYGYEKIEIRFKDKKEFDLFKKLYL